MERLFEIEVTIGGYKKERETEIIKACTVEWGFREDEFTHVPDNCGRKRLLQGAGVSTTSDNEDIEDIVARIERAIWRVNGSVCHVECHVLPMGKIGGQSDEASHEEDERMIA